MPLPVLEILEPFGVATTLDTAVDTAPEEVRELVRAHQLVVLRGLPADLDVAAWSARLGEVMVWPFGQVLEIEESALAPGGDAVPFHWDGMYQPLVPELYVLHCVRADGPGHLARTTFCHTTRLLSGLDLATGERWRRTRVTYPIPAGEPRTARSPLVVAHPVTGVPTVRFHEQPVLDPGLLAELRTALRDPRWLYAHHWQPGDLLIADNHALLHGREPLAPACSRHLRRVHVLGDPAHRNPAI